MLKYKMQCPKDEFLQPCHVGLELNDGDDPNTTSPKWKPTFSSHGLIAISKHYIVALHCTINISSLIYYSSMKCYQVKNWNVLNWENLLIFI